MLDNLNQIDIRPQLYLSGIDPSITGDGAFYFFPSVLFGLKSTLSDNSIAASVSF